MSIRLTIDGETVAENLTGLMVQVDPQGNVAIDVQRYRPEHQKEQERQARAQIDEVTARRATTT